MTPWNTVPPPVISALYIISFSNLKVVSAAGNCPPLLQSPSATCNKHTKLLAKQYLKGSALINVSRIQLKFLSVLLFVCIHARVECCTLYRVMSQNAKEPFPCLRSLIWLCVKSHRLSSWNLGYFVLTTSNFLRK